MAEAAPSGLQAAQDRIRETAKRLTIGLGGLGGILVAGSQLSALGTLEVGSERFSAAVIGAVLAGVGAALVLVSPACVATVRAVSLSGLAKKAPSGVKGHLTAPADAVRLTEVQAAESRLTGLHGTAIGLLTVASYERISRAWRVAMIVICLGAAIAACGVGVFAWAANPPTGAEGTASQPAVLTQGKPGRLELSDTGREALDTALGPGCPVAAPVAVVRLGPVGESQDVLVQQPPCRPARFLLTPQWGTVSG